MALKNTWTTGESYDATAINAVATQINTNQTDIATLNTNVTALLAPIINGNTSAQSQTVVSGTAYYIAGSALTLPASFVDAMSTTTRFRWRVAMAKTNAGTGSFQIVIYRGTNGTTSDTADVSQSIGTQTAAVDSMTVDVELAVTTTGGTGGYYWAINPVHSAVTATGFGVATGATGQFSGTKSSVAMNTSGLKFGLGFIATTGTPTITIPMVQATAINIW